MNRRRFVTASVSSLLFSFGDGAFISSFAAAPEPTYTVTLPGNLTLGLRVESTVAPDGRRKVRVWNQPKSAAKSDLQFDTSMVLDADGKAVSSRSFIGDNSDQGMTVEAVRSASGFTVREPALEGDLQFGAPIFTPLVAELFVGRMYDFKRGGPQTFSHLLDSFVSTAKIATLTLTAEGKPEVIELPDGPVKARKLRYLLSEPLIPEPMRGGVFYVGPHGEVLKCDSAFFGVPLRAKGPAVLENDGRRVTLRFKNPDSADRIVLLQADKKGSGEWDIRLKFENQNENLATLTCDSGYRLKRMDTPWHGRPFVASVVRADTIHWKLAAGPDQQSPVSADSPVWFLPHWFTTDQWEGSGRPFADMAVDETREGVLLPIAFGQRDATNFTLERLPDIAAQGLRHYRFYNGGKQAGQVATLPGAPPKGPAPRYDLYTDGSHLVIFLASDGIKIVRTGWDAFAAKLTPPSAATAVAAPN